MSPSLLQNFIYIAFIHSYSKCLSNTIRGCVLHAKHWGSGTHLLPHPFIKCLTRLAHQHSLPVEVFLEPRQACTFIFSLESQLQLSHHLQPSLLPSYTPPCPHTHRCMCGQGRSEFPISSYSFSLAYTHVHICTALFPSKLFLRWLFGLKC